MQNFSKKNFLDNIGEIWGLLIHFRLKDLLITPSENELLQLFRYGITAVLATAVDFLGLYIGTECGLHYLIGTAIGYVGGILVTYFLSKLTVFNKAASGVSSAVEMLIHFAIGMIAMGLTELLMWVFTDLAHIYYMVSKIISTVLVFFWNYYSRKWIYTKILYK